MLMYYIMFKQALIIIPFAVFIGASQVQAFSAALPSANTVREAQTERTLLAQQELDLSIRHVDPGINGVFKDNILLNFAYLSGRVNNASQVNWDEVRKPVTYEFTLQPGEVFAYHDSILPQYQADVVKIGGSHFGGEDGYRSSGYLYGDGVCHFASLINWTAQSAGLEVLAPTNHDFAMIPGIDRVYGTAIYYAYGQPEVSSMQNLYVKNTFDHPVTFAFESAGDTLTVRVYK
jgi:hypothetical protein